jgi:uncharacterized Zn finger protein
LIDIDETLLIRLAGIGAFGRGLHFFEEGRVGNIESTEKSTSASVRDDHQYDVQLRHTHRMLEGACDCPDSDGIDFCKHCVAVALALQEGHTLIKPITKKNVMSAIRRNLSRLNHEELTEEFMSIVGRDRALRDDLLQKAQFASGALSYADLREMISCITPEEDLYEFREVRAYFRKFESILSRIGEVVDQLEPVVLLRAVEYAVKRLDEDLESIDDIGDFREQTMEMLLHLHLSAVGRLDWTPPELASYLVDRSLTEGWHPFQYDADLYPEQLGDAFRVAIFDEIESRLAGLTNLPAVGTTEPEPTGRLLTQLQAQLNVAVVPGD